MSEPTPTYNKSMFLISNMYPSKKFPSFGIFVKNFEKGYLSNGGIISVKAVIDIIETKNWNKIFQYMKYYLEILYKGFFKRYDFIYVHYVAHNSFPVLILQLILKKKVIINIHGDDILPRTSFVKFLQHFVRHTIKRSKLIVVPSSFFKDVLLKKKYCDSSKIYISPSAGINLGLFKPTPESRAMWGISDTDLVIGFVSRIDLGKGWDIFLKCIKRLSDDTDLKIIALIVGSGLEVRAMQEMIMDLNLSEKIRYFNKIDHEKLPSIYCSMDIFVFPTTLDESLGLAGIEAMACGVPVVGSEIGGLKTYIINDYNGYFFEPGNVDDLFSKIINFQKLGDDRKKEIIKNCISTAQKYDSKEVNKQLKSKVDHVLAYP